jgi:hypothetical protein
MGYIDPNTGGMLFQVLAAGFALLTGGVLLFARQIRAGFARLRRWFRERKKDKVENAVEENQD